MSPESRTGSPSLLRRLIKKLFRLYLWPLRRVLHDEPAAPGSLRARLREMLQRDRALLASLLDPEMKALRELLAQDKAKRLKQLLDANDYALAKAAFEPSSDRLVEVLDSDDRARLKHVLAAESYARLIDCLTEDDLAAARAVFGAKSRMLRELLLADDATRLKAVLADDDYAILRDMCGARSRMLRAIASHNGYQGVREILSENEYAGLMQVLLAKEAKAFRDVLLLDESRPLRRVLLADEARTLHKVLFHGGVMHDIIAMPLAQAWLEFETQWRRLQPWHPADTLELPARLERARDRLKSTADVPARIIDVLAPEEDLQVGAFHMRFTDRHALWTLLQELLVNEDYFADIDATSPRIVDGGAHQGMSLLYFKMRFPDARITAFEPDPANRAIAEENMRRNGFDDVEILPFALAAVPGTATFHVAKGFSMAGSLTERRREMGNETEAIDVSCVTLSPYLDAPVDYLKLDIEGSEDTVLQEARAQLGNVHYLFCEYHHGHGLDSDRLVRILELLEQAGFEAQVAKSYSYHRRTEHRPMTHVGEAYSAIIFARNRVWPPAATATESAPEHV